jgi:pimeloyl-ACP methyl ester carboxylesterase
LNLFPIDITLSLPVYSRDDFAVSDVLAAAARAPEGMPLVGVGHSFGGAALIKAELAQPGTFAALVLSEPILFPHDVKPGDRAALADRAKKRRAQWSSKDEARSFFESRPMFQAWHPAALAGYLEGGLVDRNIGKSPGSKNNEVHLACSPDSEAACYGGPGRSIFAELPRVECPVTILVGARSKHLDNVPIDGDNDESMTTLGYIQSLSKRLPRGRVIVLDDSGHFHPQERPDTVADIIDMAVTETLASKPLHSKL